jgi:transcriptional regulator with XRE-family HTH domain
LRQDWIPSLAIWPASAGLFVTVRVFGNPSMSTRSIRHRLKDIDRHVGARMRERRIMLGLSQQQMAELVGVTYQQAHKYEKGINRVAAGRLYSIAQALGVDVGYFFEGLYSEKALRTTPQQRMMLDLARNFNAIPSRKHQEEIVSLARALAEPDPGTLAARDSHRHQAPASI